MLLKSVSKHTFSLAIMRTNYNIYLQSHNCFFRRFNVWFAGPLEQAASQVRKPEDVIERNVPSSSLIENQPCKPRLSAFPFPTLGHWCFAGYKAQNSQDTATGATSWTRLIHTCDPPANIFHLLGAISFFFSFHVSNDTMSQVVAIIFRVPIYFLCIVAFAYLVYLSLLFTHPFPGCRLNHGLHRK